MSRLVTKKIEENHLYFCQSLFHVLICTHEYNWDGDYYDKTPQTVGTLLEKNAVDIEKVVYNHEENGSKHAP